MPLKIFNSLTGKKEVFNSIHKNEINMYVCGITPYDSCHIGHARSFVTFDMVARYLRHIGYKVNYARNITDIDDKIINKANELKTSCKEIAQQYIKEMRELEQALGLHNPTFEPKATECIGDIIEFIKKLMQKKIAYVAKSGDVCFNVRSIKEYGKLSNRKLLNCNDDAAIQNKINDQDFVLWKLSKPNEPSWSSEWGMGRPGWHIECSAMSQKLLGETIDIHAGGIDLKFPHHENEIAQSEALTNKKFANFWMHSGLITVNNIKMSKSLNNYVTLKEALKIHNTEELKLFF